MENHFGIGIFSVSVDRIPRKGYTEENEKEVFPMDKQRISYYLNQYAPSVLVILCGLILVISPDNATILVSHILGWGLFAVGLVWGVVLLSARARLGQFLGAAVCILLGLWLTNNPLALAKSLGRLVGIFVILRSVQELMGSALKQGKVLAVLMIILGVILVLIPMTASRLAFFLLGGVLVLMGIGMLLEAIRGGNDRLDSGDDTNIIDAL